jgi:D-arabinose 1-dehydrogenase-like Zn-dependent alcohol dehydrogenase
MRTTMMGIGAWRLNPSYAAAATHRESAMPLSYDVVKWGEPLERRERPLPRPAGTEVLLRLKYCGVCHSDVHIRDGYFELGGGRRLHMEDRGMRLPVTLGHEPFGTVIDAGPEAVDAPRDQDRLVYPWTGCGSCQSCAAELDTYCMAARMIGIQRSGGYADHLIVPHPRYLIDTGDLDPAWAATLSCSGLSAYSAVSKLRPIPRDDWIAVWGAGGLGLSAVSMLRALGHERIIAVDLDPVKLRAAEKSGAVARVDARQADAAQQLKAISGGCLYGAVDFVGLKETAEFALNALRKGGRLVVVGLYGGEIRLSLGSLILRALTIQGSHLGSLSELREVVALAQQGKLRPIPVETRPLSAVSETLDELKAGKITGRVVAKI